MHDAAPSESGLTAGIVVPPYHWYWNRTIGPLYDRPSRCVLSIIPLSLWPGLNRLHSFTQGGGLPDPASTTVT